MSGKSSSSCLSACRRPDHERRNTQSPGTYAGFTSSHRQQHRQHRSDCTYSDYGKPANKVPVTHGEGRGDRDTAEGTCKGGNPKNRTRWLVARCPMATGGKDVRKNSDGIWPRPLQVGAGDLVDHCCFGVSALSLRDSSVAATCGGGSVGLAGWR